MNKKGQSTVEYILLVTAVIAVIIYVTMGNNSMFQTRLNNTINMTTDGMERLANRLTNTIP